MSSSSGTSSRVSGQSGSSGRSRRPGLGGDGSGDLYHGSLLEGHPYDTRPEPSNSASTSTGSRYPSSSTYARSGVRVPNPHFAGLNLPGATAPSFSSSPLTDPILQALYSASASQPSTSPSAVLIRQTPSASTVSELTATEIDTEVQSQIQNAPRPRGSGTPDTSQTNSGEQQLGYDEQNHAAAVVLTEAEILVGLSVPGKSVVSLCLTMEANFHLNYQLDTRSHYRYLTQIMIQEGISLTTS
jgi:hypothetical protein